MQFYILMVDYGKKTPGKSAHGFEAVCNPELTRRDIVDEVREIMNFPRGRSVAFVKFADGNYIEDVTEDIIQEAIALQAQAAE